MYLYVFDSIMLYWVTCIANGISIITDRLASYDLCTLFRGHGV